MKGHARQSAGQIAIPEVTSPPCGLMDKKSEPLIEYFVFLVNDISEVASGRRRKPRRALELAGIEFIDENGGGPGVRLRKPQRSKQSK